jgi:hypothetical protein
VYFGYAVHKDGLIVSHGGCHDEEDKVLAAGHGDYTGWSLARFPVPGNQSFKGVKVGDVIDLAWRPTFIPPAPLGTVIDMWDNRTVIVAEATSEDVLIVSQLQSFPPTAKVAYTVKRHVVNAPPSPEEIASALAKAKADGAVLYQAEEPILKELFRVKDGKFFDLKTNKMAAGFVYGFEAKKGLLGRAWAKMFGG